MNTEILKLNGVSKKYKLGMIGGTTLRDEIQRKRAAKKGKEDPTKMIGKSYSGNTGDDFYALSDICFTVNKGDRVGIIGHNGAGKSTLLKLISRITAPTTGTIEMSGRIATMLEVGTGFHPELSGRENIYLNGAILGMSKAEIDRKIDNIIAFAEMERFIDTPVKRYSSGMYVKLAFAVAAHLDADIMIMDEVLAVGDMRFQQKCLGKMNDVSSDEGRTILYVSHNMNTIRYLCNRCIVLDHGKLIYDGDVETAIGIYADINDRMKYHYDYSQITRSGMVSLKYELLSTDVLNDSKKEIQIGDIVRFKVAIKEHFHLENVYLQVKMCASNGNRVGIMLAQIPTNAKDSDIIEVTFNLATSNLAASSYILQFALVEKNEFGNINYIDSVDKALILEIVKGNVASFEWDTSEGGHVLLKNLTVERGM